jgi:hypothetical protein
LKVFESEHDNVGTAQFVQVLRGDHVQLKQDLWSTVEKDVNQTQHANVHVASNLLAYVVLFPFGIVEYRTTCPTFQCEHKALYVLPHKIQLKDDKEYRAYPERDRSAYFLLVRLLFVLLLLFVVIVYVPRQTEQ